MNEVKMPQMGESIVEGTVTKWLKQVGDKVERDEALFEISTDKVDSEVPSPVAGVLKEILVPEGETVEIETVVARIDDGSDGAEKAAEKPTAKKRKTEAPPAEQPAPATASNGAPTAAEPVGERVRSSPLVRRLAREHGVDLSQVPGTGQGGRISKKDFEAYRKQRERGAAAPKAAPAAAPAAEALATFRPAPEVRFGEFEVRPLSVMRKRIAEHMVLTKRVSPHVATVHQIDCTTVARLREANKRKFLAQNGVKLTFMPFFLKAAASALKAFPAVNASLDADNVVYHRDINIGMAVAIEDGLIVPVIRGADELSLLGLQRAVNDLADRARHKRLKPEEVREGTFSISNYGSYGSLFATPAINQPQAAILGLGAIRKTPVVIHDAIAIRSVCLVTLTFDHRLLDGAVADQFLTHLRTVVEEWNEAVL